MDNQTEASRLLRQVDFIVEIDRLKSVFRQTLLMDRSRHENSAEHSWHLAVLAIVLAEHAETDHLDLERVVGMALLHDVVEIDAGDVLVYDTAARAARAEAEAAAAERIFGLLPPDQARDFRALWREFEERGTAEAKFVAALDRFQPVLHNCRTQGAAWQSHGIDAAMVIERNRHMEEGSPALWRLTRAMIERAVASGHLAPGPPAPPDAG